ncbi:MAG: hypothetical protein ACI33N_02610 [Desulfovibrionaceae bacterium]|nr:hypothetical protein [Desulfovibrionaceae bacterium]
MTGGLSSGLRLLLCACAACLLAQPAFAARPTGMEGLANESGVNRIERRQFPQGAVAVDAYGNPVVPEPEKERPRIRPGAGAYGGYGSRPQPERPLPDPDRETDPVWNFNKP